MQSSSSAMSADEKAILAAATFFNTVVDSYIEAANTRFVPATLFIRKHGKSGIERAQHLKFIWRYIRIDLQDSMEKGAIHQPHLYILAELKRVLADKKLMPGKYKRHSLKTYLLAYYLALVEWDSSKDIKLLFEQQINILQDKQSADIQTAYESTFKSELNPSAYQPNQLFRIAMYELLLKMELTNIDSSHSNADAEVTIGTRKFNLPDFCDFKRLDNVRVRFYYPVSHLSADDWIKKYGVMTLAFSNNGIVIIPILHVNDNKQQLSLVVICENHTSMFNEIESSQHAINYAVILAGLPVEMFESKAVVKEALEKSRLYYREDDELILSRDQFYRELQPTDVSATPGHNEFQFLTAMQENIKKEKQRRQTFALIEAKNAIQSYIDRATAAGKGHFRIEMAIFLNEKLEEKLNEKNRLVEIEKKIDNFSQDKKVVEDLISICKLDEAEKIKTINALAVDKKILFREFDKLYVIKVTLEKLSGSNFAECALMLCCYDSILDKNSGLRQAVAFGLLCMLNAERDYKKTLEPVFTYAPDSLSGFFNECLRLESQRLYGGGLVEEYKMMKEDMGKWENISTNLHARLMEKNDARKQRHQAMKGDDDVGIKKVFENFKKDVAKAKGKRLGKMEVEKFVVPRRW